MLHKLILCHFDCVDLDLAAPNQILRPMHIHVITLHACAHGLGNQYTKANLSKFVFQMSILAAMTRVRTAELVRIQGN